MLISIIIALLFGTVLGFLCFLKPQWLSENITELSSTKSKRVWYIGSVITISLFIIYLEPVSVNEWLIFFFGSIFFFISSIDIYSRIIPNKLLVIMAIPPVVNVFRLEVIEPIVAFIGVFTICSLIYVSVLKVLDKRIFGFGDFKLIALIAFFIGWKVLWVIYLAVILGGFFAMVGILLKFLNRESRIPFAPFLFVAYLSIIYT